MAKRPWTNEQTRTLSASRWVQTFFGMVGEPSLPNVSWSRGLDPLSRKAILIYSFRGGRTATISFAPGVPSDEGPWMVTTHQGGPTCMTTLPHRLVLDRIRNLRGWLLEESEPEPEREPDAQ